MKNLEIDIETYSSIDLSKCGVYKYAEADDFEILLFGYSVDGGDVAVVDLAAGERIPQNVLDPVTHLGRHNYSSYNSYSSYHEKDTRALRGQKVQCEFRALQEQTAPVW